MIKRERLARYLAELGLNEYETRVYLTLVEGGVMTAPQVAKLSRVPAQRVYDVLERLLEKGLIYLAPGQRKRYGAAEPKLGLSAYLERLRTQMMQEHEAKAKLVAEISGELEAIYKAGEMEELLEYVKIAKDPYYVGAMFLKLQEDSQREVLGFVKPPYTVAPAENYEAQKKAMMRGVKYYGIYEIGALNGETEEYVKVGIALGEEARLVEEVPIKAVVFDGKSVIFSLHDPGRQTYTCFILEHPHIAKALSTAFWALWHSGIRPEDYFGKSLSEDLKRIKAQLGL